LDRVLKAKDYRVRAAGVRVLSFWLDQVAASAWKPSGL
jgi:hypothetical protein